VPHCDALPLQGGGRQSWDGGCNGARHRGGSRRKPQRLILWVRGWKRAWTHRIVARSGAEALGVVCAKAVLEEHLEVEGGRASLFEGQRALHARRGNGRVWDWEGGPVRPFTGGGGDVRRFPSLEGGAFGGERGGEKCVCVIGRPRRVHQGCDFCRGGRANRVERCGDQVEGDLV